MKRETKPVKCAPPRVWSLASCGKQPATTSDLPPRSRRSSHPRILDSHRRLSRLFSILGHCDSTSRPNHLFASYSVDRRAMIGTIRSESTRVGLRNNRYLLSNRSARSRITRGWYICQITSSKNRDLERWLLASSAILSPLNFCLWNSAGRHMICNINISCNTNEYAIIT